MKITGKFTGIALKFALPITLVGSLSFGFAWDCSENRTEQRIYEEIAHDPDWAYAPVDSFFARRVTVYDTLRYRSTFHDTIQIPQTVVYVDTIQVLDRVTVWDTIRVAEVPPIPLWMKDPRRTGAIWF